MLRGLGREGREGRGIVGRWEYVQAMAGQARNMLYNILLLLLLHHDNSL